MNTFARRALPALLIVGLLVAACGGGASSPSVDPILGDPNTPASQEPIGDPPPPGGPVTGELTIPQPGQLDVHPVAAEHLEAQVIGRAVTVRVTWTSGVEPCYVLDSIAVERAGTTFIVTVLEGHGPGDNVCIEIAKTKQALVDLGELEPGTYTINDGTNTAASIEVTVS